MPKKLPFTIDRNDPANLPEQVAAGFRMAIRSGHYKPGDILPARGEIAAALGISVRVPREAMRILAAESLVRPGRGVGCVVMARRETLYKGRVLVIERAACVGTYSAAVIVNEVRHLLMRAGYLCASVSTCLKRGGKNLDLRPVEDALRMPTDFAFSVFPTENLVRHLSRRVAFLSLGGRSGGRDAIDIPWSHPFEQLAAQCRKTGVRRILYASYGPSADVQAAFRSAGFKVEEMSIWPRDDFGYLEATEHRAFEAVRDRFAAKRRLPDLVYFGDDYVARGGLMALASLGVKVPEDVKVATLANKGFVPVFPVSLARIEFDPFAAAAFIADTIADRIEGRPTVRQPDFMRYIAGESLPAR